METSLETVAGAGISLGQKEGGERNRQKDKIEHGNALSFVGCRTLGVGGIKLRSGTCGSDIRNA